VNRNKRDMMALNGSPKATEQNTGKGIEVAE